MGFDATLTTIGRQAVIALEGALDAEHDERFREKVEQAAALDVTELILDMKALDRLSAAGVRTVAYARQQMPDEVEVVIVSPTDHVLRTLIDADFDDSVAIRT